MSLKGRKGSIVGFANRNSIAFGCAEVLRGAGAELGVTYLNAKVEPFVRPPAEELGTPIVIPCDVREPGQLEAVFLHIREQWGRLDLLLQSIAYAPKEDLHSRIVDCSQAGFAMAMVSCHSLIRMARLAEPLMTDGGCLLTVTFYGAEKVVEQYDLMGPVKSAHEICVRYLAAGLGPKRISVHALSPGPLKTRAASGIERFDELLERARPHARAKPRLCNRRPSYPRPLFEYAIDLAHALGIPVPRVAIRSAIETVTEKIKSTLDAAALCKKMADRGQITGGILDGPLASTMRSRPSQPGPKGSPRRSPAVPTFSWCRTSRPATCWRSNLSIWRKRRWPESCWARVCRSF